MRSQEFILYISAPVDVHISKKDIEILLVNMDSRVMPEFIEIVKARESEMDNRNNENFRKILCSLVIEFELEAGKKVEYKIGSISKYKLKRLRRFKPSKRHRTLK